MSLFDELRGVAKDLFAEFDLPPVTLTRTTQVAPSRADKAAGRTQPSTTTTIKGVGVLASRKLALANGVIAQQSIARLSVVAMKGDKLKIGKREFTVAATEEVAPDGGTPFVVIAILE